MTQRVKSGDVVGVAVKKLNDSAMLPTKATPGSVGFDVAANISAKITIGPGLSALVGTGIALEMPDDVWCKVYIRSGFARKKGAGLANGVGVIDSDYRKEVGLVIVNQNRVSDVVIEPGERIGQLVFERKLPVELRVVGEIAETGRGGWGSTGQMIGQMIGQMAGESRASAGSETAQSVGAYPTSPKAADEPRLADPDTTPAPLPVFRLEGSRE